MKPPLSEDARCLPPAVQASSGLVSGRNRGSRCTREGGQVVNRDVMRVTMRVIKALSDPQRVRILMMLEPGEICVCQIVEVLTLAPSTVSKHLSILSAAGLVSSRKDGRWAYYRLGSGDGSAAARPMVKWLGWTLKSDAIIGADAARLRRVMARDPGVICKRRRSGSGGELRLRRAAVRRRPARKAMKE